VRSLGEYSPPRGHAPHAVRCRLLLSLCYPTMNCAPGIFAVLVLVELSRVVPALHRSSDRLAGAAIGWAANKLVLSRF
jgi:hypothetical protein